MTLAAHPLSWLRCLSIFTTSLLFVLATSKAYTQDAFQPSGLPPALLPKKAQVAPGAPSAIDGIWTISTLGKRIRIEAGRAYAVDAWAHLGLLEVQPDMVVIQNIQRVDQGRYGGDDLPLLGRLSTQLQPGAMDVSVAGAFGPVRYQLIAVQLDDPDAYQRELGASLPAPPPGVTPWPTPNPPPGITPAPPPKPRPNPRPSPSPRGCGGIGEQPCEIVPAQYVGKEHFRPIYDQLHKFLVGLGNDVEVAPKKANVSYRRKKQFALLTPATKTRFEIGLNVKGQPDQGVLRAITKANAMCSHQIDLAGVEDITPEVLDWLKKSYELAG